ncbi:hypothetical protein [Azohydromonas lata]|uniref:Type-F conjugative transfer system protein TrbI n=2 Tax=Azohydromonas TaxID=312063 RepID=A0ABU5I7H7_9BURK|nr:hypothetical protein [Azohydromonas lata]MDZ5455051.1 hypothetical protein [Azohydromonas lata]
MRAPVIHVAISVAVMSLGLLAYDRFVVRPSRLIGVVDVGAVYRSKESQFAQMLSRSTTDQERDQAMQQATRFSRQLPEALDELPQACGCLVVVKSAVAGLAPNMIDLTPMLVRKLESAK